MSTFGIFVILFVDVFCILNFLNSTEQVGGRYGETKAGESRVTSFCYGVCLCQIKMFVKLLCNMH